MNCIFCSMPETQFDMNSGRVPTRHPKDVTGIICSNCFQIIASSPQDQVQRAYQLAVSQGVDNKAKALETFLGEEIIDNGETKKPSRDMGRIRALRKIGSAGHKVRPKHTVRQLDKRRSAVC